jgi:oligopeptide transport system ATP-binding protein
MATNNVILKIEDFNLYYKDILGKKLQILYDINIELNNDEILGIIGESGSGKTQAVLSIMKLFGQNAIYSGKILYNNKNLLLLSEKEINKYRCKDIAIAFQNAVSSLHPSITIKDQLIEPLITHKNISEEEAVKEAIDILDLVRIKDAKNKINHYPYEFSGGMLQRVMIAMSIICHPKIFIADELTTALDVSAQNIVLRILKDIQNEFGMSIIFITHDLKVLSQIADRVVVMYCGNIVEEASTKDLIEQPMHPYTKGLISSIPNLEKKSKRLDTIPGDIPQLNNMPQGCCFSTRCTYACDKCHKEKPFTQNFDKRKVACFNYLKN